MCLPKYSQFRLATLGWRRYNFSYERPLAEIIADLARTDVELKFEDFEMNGRHCKSGLAYQNGKDAVCEDAYMIQQDGRNLTGENFYECDPYDNEKPCEIYYD